MKAIVVSDLHIGIHKDDEIWLNQADMLFDQIHDTAKREKINTLIIAGDFFHERKSINVATLCKAYEILDKIKDLEIIFLLGNHDIYYKNVSYPNSLSIMALLPHVKVISEPTVIEDIIFLPWSTSTYDIKSFQEPYLIGHLEIDGFPSTVCEDFKGGYTRKEFKHFKQVISGHLHIPSRMSNILYCGSPYHLSFNDRGSICGYYIFDNGDISFIENKDYARYIKINTEDDPEEKLIRDNIVELSYVKDYGIIGNNRKLEYIQSMNPKRLYTDFTNISICNSIDGAKTQTDENNLKVVSNKDIFEEYIQTIRVPEHIKIPTLLSIIDKLLKEKTI